MRNSILTIVLVLMVSITNASDGIRFFQGTWEEALLEASTSNKPIFVDFYAEWCGPCKRMSRDIFTDLEVGKYFNENFVSLKIDAENEEQKLVERVDITAYPTLIFFNPSGEILLKNVGAIESMELLEKASLVKNIGRTTTRYKENPNDINVLNEYLSVIVSSNPDEASRLAIQYLERLNDDEKISEASWELIRKYVNDFDSGIFQFVFENKEKYFEEFKGVDDYFLKILDIVISEAIEAEDKSMLNLAYRIEIETRKMIGILEKPEEYYRLETDYIFYKNLGNEEMYINTYRQFVEQFMMEDHIDLALAAATLAEEHYISGALDLAVSWALKAVSLHDDWTSNFVVAYVYYKADNYEKARNYARIALTRTDNDEEIDYTNTLLTNLDL